MLHVTRTRRSQTNINKAGVRKKREIKEKFGIKIPRNIKEALLFDKENQNNKWMDAVLKEMTALKKLKCFKFHPSNTQFSKSNGWQYCPLHMIFDIKQQDMRHKARLVAGGNVIDSSSYNTNSTTVHDISIRLMMLIAVKNRLGLMAGDIGNAFPTAPNMEKVWTIAGAEFGEQAGSVVEIMRALYGLSTASRAFHEFLGDCLRRMKFNPTRADPDLWIRKSPDYDGYDFIATHVDDLLIAAKNPTQYMSMLEQEFYIRNIEDSPSYYRGCDISNNNGRWHVSTKKYVAEVLRSYQSKHGDIKKENIPMSVGIHPELDASDFLNDEGHKLYQHIIGTCQWLIVCGRIDINYAVASLSRFSSSPRENHLKLAVKILGYLKKYPKRGYVINSAKPKIDLNYETVKFSKDFGVQYSYFKEDIDPRFPEPLMEELECNIFVDSDHGHDKVTGRSITGLIGFVGSTPTIWSSKRQASVQVSTFGAEFTALKKAVEEAVSIRYYLRSMGVKVTKPTVIYCDNMGVVINCSDPSSGLNKKTIALAYHFTREHIANNVVEIRKIHSDDNYADPLTKAVNSREHNDFFYEFLKN